MRASLDELIDAGEFTRRHISATDTDRQHMLSVIGEASVESLLAHTVPPAIRMDHSLGLAGPRSPRSVLGELRELAALNETRTSLIGMGYYGTITPPVVLRKVLENPAWYSAYTPYQPEISQGRLEALLNFQTMVAELTGFEIANASLLDEATAAAEAMTMARRLSKSDSNRFVVHRDTHPQTLAVLATRAEAAGIEVVVGDDDDIAGGCFGALFSLPTSSGAIIDWSEAITSVHAVDGLAIVATDLLACVLTVPPAQLGADIAIGSAQRFGQSMGFGGPHAAFIATGNSMVRALPGRLIGVSVDSAGRPALRLALQTREQHIRREKATSNICTAQVLLANVAGFYAVWHGPDGLRKIAERVHRLTSIAAEALVAGGFSLVNDTWFDTLQVRCTASSVLLQASERGLDLRLVDDETIGFSFDETSSLSTVAAVLAAFDVSAQVADTTTSGLPRRRSDEFLTQTVFARYHTEHEMLRYLRRLSDKDLALDRTMIPLGSCTMKLNATVEMEPITWPGLADMHPYTPEESTVGIRTMIAQLEAMLVAITGYDAVSLQPNAGSQGEFSGLLAIRAYHRSRGDAGRTVCLIPSSAHGTNAASAVMAGLKVVVVKCDDRGNIDLVDLEAKAVAAGDALAAAMVTYPSTHGVFEADIRELCEIIHRRGGQVYVDGANLNAIVGLAQPGKFGADVSHLNLHKTFCIPHGGGGPGVGPVAVRAHLAPFLPAHPLASAGQPVGAVAAAPFGSASILSISWVYIALMGASGLTDASAMAVLNANYIATRLNPHYPVLYTGEHGRVAHECIVDLRPITHLTGVTVGDVAKRLIDYGFHAPTVSFPVVGTLMIEPTESESLYELDRFCAAMIAIKGEIDEVAAGTWELESSPLRHAPHTAEDLIGEWNRPYSRELGAYPVAALRAAKYFPPVSRIDEVYGDRHLVCNCEPLEVLAAATS